MLREGRDGFKGGRNPRKVMKRTGCSMATVTHDLARPLQLGAFRKLEGGGRSTRYDVRLPDAWGRGVSVRSSAPGGAAMPKAESNARPGRSSDL